MGAIIPYSGRSIPCYRRENSLFGHLGNLLGKRLETLVICRSKNGIIVLFCENSLFLGA
jgi:hypothetical protein